jgi:polyphosphate kinase 2 (PPK2 family)
MYNIGQKGSHPMPNDPHTTPEKLKLKRKEYEEKLRKLQIELCKLQEWVLVSAKQ